MNTSPEVYKLDSTGKIRTWQYVVNGDSWYTIAGLQDGKKVTSAPTVCVPASQPTAELQAQFEADAEMKKKLKRDYHETVHLTAVPNYFKPMLAEKYDPALVEEGDLAQPKLDGIRCVASLKGGLRTRKGEPITSCPHIIDQLKPIFIKYPDLIIDGELYNHDLKDNFNELASIIRKKTPDEAQIRKAAVGIEYHVYDLVNAGNFGVPASTRNSWLNNIVADVSPSIIPVPTEIVDNDEEMRAFFAKCVAQGYEGAMLRKANAPYRQTRTSELMKFKEFITEEFIISGIFEGLGNWAGCAKSVEFIMTDDRRKENGDRPDAGIKGNQAFCKALLARKDELIGKPMTLRYFELTPAGIPRFPVAIDFDRTDA